MRGFYVTLLFHLGSLRIELVPHSVGFGAERSSANDVDFFAGRLTGCWSRHREGRLSARKG
ncbi:hypothetical protein SAMN06297251_12344 [Fulvimarina manganoxydans]|uniref:Uncharacterized protein n=1 Tax=Fulvimarina manganoxydans TaxID=937218 RepID=A0A1W2EC24_9HYPH|nr:hypothetical protein [Fulvimarina manganoxydans]SMD06942.1 hypothetical protein SAMN06297251_12344 [Fulvimarina manganoxydans]